MQKLLVIDNVPFARQHAAQIALTVLPRNGDLQMFEAKSDATGLDMFQRLHPNMVILDVSFSGAGGLSLAKAIWEIERKTKIIFWVHTHSDANLGEIAKMVPAEGTFGYVLKAEGDEKLRYAMTAVFLNSSQYTDPIARTVTGRPAFKSDFLTAAEMETLVDIALGLTDRAIAKRRKLTVRGVQNRLSTLALKILRRDHWKLRQSAELEVFNPRTRIVIEALNRGYLRIEQLQAAEQECETWLGLAQMAKPTTKTLSGKQIENRDEVNRNVMDQSQTNFAPNIQSISVVQNLNSARV